MNYGSILKFPLLSWPTQMIGTYFSPIITPSSILMMMKDYVDIKFVSLALPLHANVEKMETVLSMSRDALSPNQISYTWNMTSHSDIK
jgi:hypothetical protein